MSICHGPQVHRQYLYRCNIPRDLTADRGYDARSLYRAGVSLSAKDLEVALSKARTSYAESIGAPKIPNVTWDDVGGLASVKADILDTIQLPLEHPELFSNGMKKRSGKQY